MDLLEGFDGPEVATLLVSLAAVGVSVWAIVRTRAPKPHWVLSWTTEEMVPEILPSYGGVLPAWNNDIPQWHAVIKQLGPAAAESISSQVRTPDGSWTKLHEDQYPQIGRGGAIKIILCSKVKTPGSYRVRLLYRQLPNTRKERVFESDVTLD
jgi:hypothetical protein